MRFEVAIPLVYASIYAAGLIVRDDPVDLIYSGLIGLETAKEDLWPKYL